MDKELLLSQIYTEIEGIGLPVDLDIELRGYSKNYDGLYDPNIKKAVIYMLDEQGELLPKDYYMDTVIHELIHHYQWQHTDYVRVKGIMHNAQFFKLFSKYMKIWKFKYGRKKHA